jgi:hypothetical protein
MPQPKSRPAIYHTIMVSCARSGTVGSQLTLVPAYETRPELDPPPAPPPEVGLDVGALEVVEEARVVVAVPGKHWE